MKKPITKFNYYYLPKIKKVARFIGIMILVGLFEIIVMAIGSQADLK